MNKNEFIASLGSEKPPENLSQPLLSLWHDAKGDWQYSHEIAQEIESRGGSLIHAYLHRKEGDQFNADYWYHRAGSHMPDVPLDEEWQQLVEHFCGDA